MNYIFTILIAVTVTLGLTIFAVERRVEVDWQELKAKHDKCKEKLPRTQTCEFIAQPIERL